MVRYLVLIAVLVGALGCEKEIHEARTAQQFQPLAVQTPPAGSQTVR